MPDGGPGKQGSEHGHEQTDGEGLAPLELVGLVAVSAVPQSVGTAPRPPMTVRTAHGGLLVEHEERGHVDDALLLLRFRDAETDDVAERVPLPAADAHELIVDTDEAAVAAERAGHGCHLASEWVRAPSPLVK